ncbi:pimeloyl-ACP methyl ester carboxylesterase [Nonomuraea muscovyensis]|uniref:Pimeloyl-ACP methyl ester carboxylesterase n=1 Tax=Nonomuraea muscovyensis TaxID=1124761 RepID=A0A7X0C308_9ACTN|nr:alpha/beta hydrolase [Nonomuraea muscovyensis]MBB6347452.1 pimeloyl-ACP methyl ester carboxylesterase [Nonomuraea muscovyensis]
MEDAPDEHGDPGIGSDRPGGRRWRCPFERQEASRIDLAGVRSAESEGHVRHGGEMVNLSSVLPLHGCDLHYRVSGGDGVPVVFSHGAGADHVMFDAQRDYLRARGCRVVTWDMRGHGRSRPAGVRFTAEQAIADLYALIQYLALDRPVLVGQSLGGNLSQALIRRHPDLARALIVIGSAWDTAPLSWKERLLVKAATPSLSMIPARSLASVLAEACAHTPDARADARRAFSQLSKKEFVHVWQATADLLDPAPHYRTPVPLCLIRGERDRTGNIASAMPRWAQAEGVEEVVIPDAGHIANQDAPHAVNAAIDAFLLTLPTSI